MTIHGNTLKASQSRNFNLLQIENVMISNDDLVNIIIDKTEPSTVSF